VPESGLTAQALPAQESWNITLTLTDSGRNSDVVKARHASEYHQGEKKELFVDGGVTVTIYDRKSGAPTVMTAGRGIVHDNQDIEAFDNVVIHTADGTLIQTDYVIRTSKNRMLRSNKHVIITRPSQTIRGSGFESDEGMLHYRIFQASGESISTK
jgi:LPS export ABC transporter protein LptC